MDYDLSPIDTVRRHYVQTGVFRRFVERSGKQCQFTWLNDATMKVVWSPRSKSLQFKDVLPEVTARSSLDKAVRAFLKGRFDSELPEHRRLDPAKVSLVCINRGSAISIGLKLLDEDEEYGARKLVNLVHEVFVFLNEHRPEYVHETFDIPFE